jgi:general L-amino acid transport system permease protein
MTTEYLAPPKTSLGPGDWLRQNLFSGWVSSLVTLVLGAFLIWLAAWIVGWAVSDARWGVITANLRLFLIGLYPPEHAWRIWLTLAIVSVIAGVSAGVYGGAAIRTLTNWLAAAQAMIAVLAFVSGLGPIVSVALVANAAVVFLAFVIGVRGRVPRRAVSLAWLLVIPLSFLLLHGIRDSPLPLVSTGQWGGLLLTFLLALVGILLSFPFGVLLALGRRSSLTGVRVLCTVYIELIRGVPLVTLLFMAAIMLPLFLPGGFRVEHVYRAMAGITLFSAAYVAENVRGGLQAIPSGQIEAAKAIGLNPLQTTRLIVLPQALRSVIPANVGLFISLLKDTTLVFYAAGLLEVLGIGQAVLAQTQWFGTQLEVYVFIATVFFILCYMMSQASYRLEEALGVGKR